ncbi:MAG TPA: hypothetical protein VGZ47_20025 [Gemmataceae bacterium]|jgi:hypothetical protein|nr:hypothetical protein [Gemmataceae bacterium]
MASNRPNHKPKVQFRGSGKLVVLTGGKILDPPEPIKKYPKAKYPKQWRKPGDKQ